LARSSGWVYRRRASSHAAAIHCRCCLLATACWPAGCWPAACACLLRRLPFYPGATPVWNVYGTCIQSAARLKGRPCCSCMGVRHWRRSPFPTQTAPTEKVTSSAAVRTCATAAVQSYISCINAAEAEQMEGTDESSSDSPLTGARPTATACTSLPSTSFHRDAAARHPHLPEQQSLH
jgi:hypothetical protein